MSLFEYSTLCDPSMLLDESTESPMTESGIYSHLDTKSGGFSPAFPRSLDSLSIPQETITAIVMRFLLNKGATWGREISAHAKIPQAIVGELLRELKTKQLVAYRKSTNASDFLYELTAQGVEFAQRSEASCSYFGAVPVNFKRYLKSVSAQSLDLQTPTKESLKAALKGLFVSPQMISRLGQSIRAGRALFLYGSPGNGKTSYAQRLCRAFGETIWIPRSLLIDDQIVRLYDPAIHEAVAVERNLKYDERWVKIKRPTVIVGGELTMEHLEMQEIGDSKVIEAPIQLKSNCGTLVIDDFGRQRMSPTDLLNRWILPLENRFDFLQLSSGRKIQVPFDQLIVFSTNLDPKELVDEAFLRRIPYKIEVVNPTDLQFRALMTRTAEKLGIGIDDAALDYLVTTHYKNVGRPMRFCHVRDLLNQIKSYCEFEEIPPRLSPPICDLIVSNYFV